MFGPTAAPCTSGMRVAGILRAGDVLQVRDMVVARVAIFVVHLPRILAGRRAKKGMGNNPMDIDVFSTDHHLAVAGRCDRTNGDCSEEIAYATMGAHLPASGQRNRQVPQLPSQS